MMDIIAVIGAAMAVIGFLSVWIKMGVEKGEHKKTMELLEQKADRHEADIAGLKNTTHTMQLDWARTMGKIEAKLDSIGKIEAKLDLIGESVAALKGGRRAEEK
jgi:uncharacterized protein YoxC